MLSTETRRALSLLHKSINATLANAVAVDLRTIPKDKRDAIKEAREVLADLGEDLHALLAESSEAAA